VGPGTRLNHTAAVGRRSSSSQPYEQRPAIETQAAVNNVLVSQVEVDPLMRDLDTSTGTDTDVRTGSKGAVCEDVASTD